MNTNLDLIRTTHFSQRCSQRNFTDEILSVFYKLCETENNKSYDAKVLIVKNKTVQFYLKEISLIKKKLLKKEFQFLSNIQVYKIIQFFKEDFIFESIFQALKILNKLESNLKKVTNLKAIECKDTCAQITIYYK